MSEFNKIEPKCIKDYTLTALRVLMGQWGNPVYRADQIFLEIYARRRDDFDVFLTIPKSLRKKLKENFILNSTEDYIAKKSSDGTVKYLFKLVNGAAVESVLIPDYDRNDEDLKRLTLCISSQVGCALDCAFCATGKLKLMRNLSAGEIVDQVLNVEKDVGLKITNVVFMGMGEPLQNYDNLVDAIDILTNDKATIIPRKKITVSTSGIVPKIEAFAESAKPAKLAISLHATTNGLRDKLMPVNKKWNIESLRHAVEIYYRKTKLPITFEYILFKGLNNSEEDIVRLARFVRSVPSKVNIIPFHDISFTGSDTSWLKPASVEEIEDFVSGLKSKGANAFVRTSAGFDIDAACGQLAFSKKKLE